MLLSVRFLTDVANVNSFEYTPQLEMAAGDGQTMYFQLIDASVDRSEQGFSPAGRRYMPPAGSSLAVTFVNINDAKQFARVAVNPFPGDSSIFSVPVLSTDPVSGTINLNMILTEPNRKLNVKFMPGVMLRVR